MIGNMNKFVKVASFMAAVALVLSLSQQTSARPKPASKDIVDTAVAAGSFKTLVAALQAAGLVDTLKSNGPFTVLAPEVTKIDSAKTVNGQSLAISVNDGTVMVDNAKVVKTDILCSNGVIHVIDSVLLPK